MKFRTAAVIIAFLLPPALASAEEPKATLEHQGKTYTLYPADINLPEMFRLAYIPDADPEKREEFLLRVKDNKITALRGLGDASIVAVAQLAPNGRKQIVVSGCSVREIFPDNLKGSYAVTTLLHTTTTGGKTVRLARPYDGHVQVFDSDDDISLMLECNASHGITGFASPLWSKKDENGEIIFGPTAIITGRIRSGFADLLGTGQPIWCEVMFCEADSTAKANEKLTLEQRESMRFTELLSCQFYDPKSKKFSEIKLGLRLDPKLRSVQDLTGVLKNHPATQPSTQPPSSGRAE